MYELRSVERDPNNRFARCLSKLKHNPHSVPVRFEPCSWKKVIVNVSIGWEPVVQVTKRSLCNRLTIFSVNAYPSLFHSLRFSDGAISPVRQLALDHFQLLLRGPLETVVEAVAHALCASRPVCNDSSSDNYGTARRNPFTYRVCGAISEDLS